MFYSVQGEGYHTGIPSIFIRFGGCNLACEWCDTSFDEWENMTLRRIIREMAPWDCNRIVLTGGEPALQDLTTLSKILRPIGYELAIETNGTIEIPQDIIDWICVSPKDQLYSSVKIRQRIGDELKVVWVGQTLDMYDELIDGFTHHFLQPCYDENKDVGWNGKNFLSTFEMVRNNPRWNLSLQTHKWMGVD
jgi:organic radical activating enzyme